MVSTERIICVFGGRDALAVLTGAKPRTVEQWLRIGVPHKHFDLLVTEAKRRSISGITHQVLYVAKAETLRRFCRKAAA